MRLGSAWLLFAVAATVPVARGQTVPRPLGTDPRVQIVDYNADQVVELRAAPGYHITVALSADEHVESVAVGDSGAWQVTSNKRGDHLFIKPLQPGVPTNMVVLTDVRSYAFDLSPLPGPQPDMAYLVQFKYPSPPAASGAAVEAAIPEIGRYKLGGDRSIRPAAIDDDGSKTFISFPAKGALPAVYASDAKGNEALVNGYVRDGLYVIDSVAPRLVFRLDKRVAYARRTVEKGEAR